MGGLDQFVLSIAGSSGLGAPLTSIAHTGLIGTDNNSIGDADGVWSFAYNHARQAASKSLPRAFLWPFARKPQPATNLSTVVMGRNRRSGTSWNPKKP